MTVQITPPGDKSISHRLLLMAPMCAGVSQIRGLASALDVGATRTAMVALGAAIAGETDDVRIEGPTRWVAPSDSIQCGNSGTTARLLSGLVAGLGLRAVIAGDDSLSRRPMDRVVYPLQAMGARFRYLKVDDRLPIEVAARRSGALRPLRHRVRFPSAQVKSSLLLAGLAAGVRVEVWEPGFSRDHTERLLRLMDGPVLVERGEDGGTRTILEEGDRSLTLTPVDVAVPGDFSAGAFMLAAAWLGLGTAEVSGVGLNPTRTGLLDVARQMGALVQIREAPGWEPLGSVRAEPSELGSFDIDPARAPMLLDEMPVLAVLAARADGTSRIRGARELRVKESDRLSALAENLRAIGVACRERSDGLDIDGTTRPLQGRVRTHGDHRIAMAFGILASTPNARIEIDDRTCVAISYPDFWRDLERLRGTGA